MTIPIIVEPIIVQADGTPAPHPARKPVQLRRSIYWPTAENAVIECPGGHEAEQLADALQAVEFVRIRRGQEAPRYYTVGKDRGSLFGVHRIELFSASLGA